MKTVYFDPEMNADVIGKLIEAAPGGGWGSALRIWAWVLDNVADGAPIPAPQELGASAGMAPSMAKEALEALHAAGALHRTAVRRSVEYSANRSLCATSEPRRLRRATQKHFLYRLYDAQGALLYIGISMRAMTRLSQHCRSKPWAEQIANVRVEVVGSYEAAAEAERLAIIAEKPRHNVLHAA